MQWRETTPFIEHRKTCDHCQKMPTRCEEGARILRRGIETILREINDPLMKREAKPCAATSMQF